MLTFDKPMPGAESSSDVAELMGIGNLPSEVECGENNEFWIILQRQTRIVELRSKVDGKILNRCKAVDTVQLKMLGLSERQIGAVQIALNLR